MYCIINEQECFIRYKDKDDKLLIKLFDCIIIIIIIIIIIVIIIVIIIIIILNLFQNGIVNNITVVILFIC